jgi:acid phosphatase (class A)
MKESSGNLRHLPLVTALAWLTFSATPLQAQQLHLHYLKPGLPDAAALLPPPPQPGSPEQAADLEETIAVHKACSPSDVALGKSEKKVFIFSFTPAIGSFFQAGKLPKTEAFFQRVLDDVQSAEATAKDHWKRPRPYTVEPRLLGNGDEMEKSTSYPSGHSMRGTVFALLLADLFPEDREYILAIGRNIGWHRVQLGRHYPTDIYAGRTLAQALVREMQANPAFQSDLAESKAELAAAKRAN